MKSMSAGAASTIPSRGIMAAGSRLVEPGNYVTTQESVMLKE